jgi:hypothetical protein
LSTGSIIGGKSQNAAYVMQPVSAVQDAKVALAYVQNIALRSCNDSNVPGQLTWPQNASPHNDIPQRQLTRPRQNGHLVPKGKSFPDVLSRRRRNATVS